MKVVATLILLLGAVTAVDRYDKHENVFCQGSDNRYGGPNTDITLSDTGSAAYSTYDLAHDDCEADDDCFGINDVKCDEGGFQLCKVTTLDESTVGTCVYKRDQPDIAGYEQILDTYCPEGDWYAGSNSETTNDNDKAAYLSAGTALADCDADADCVAIHNQNCGDSLYYLCKGIGDVGASTVGNCVHKKAEPYPQNSDKGCSESSRYSGPNADLVGGGGVLFYTNYSSAHEDCEADERCWAIYDKNCDDDYFLLCYAAAFEDSDIGSCTYSRPMVIPEDRYAKSADKYCVASEAYVNQVQYTNSNGLDYYLSYVDAHNDCEADAECSGVYDIACDEDWYQLCKYSVLGNSVSESCVYEKEPSCTDNYQNGDETGLDCGGSCDACETCDDGEMNQDETDVDCGGVCDACVVEETCTDGKQNQDETGVDCGGTCGTECTCLPRDFVNTISSPSVIAASFARNNDVDDEDTFANDGALTFTLSVANFATLTAVELQNTDGDSLSNSVVGFDYGNPTTNGCNNEFTSGAVSWMDIKDYLMLKTSGNPETGTHTELHYRAEIVVKTNNPYSPDAFQDDGVDAMGTEVRTRDVTSTFQLYFTLPERVEAWARITVVELPTAGVVENIQMQDVETVLDREDLTYVTTIGLHSTVNWPYILTYTSSEDSNSAYTVGVAERSVERVSCERTGDEDDEPDCQQFWTVTVDYGTACGDAVDGTLEITFTNTNALPNTSGNTVSDNGTSVYAISVSTEAIQCVVDAGDIDVFATLVATGSDFQIGGFADFTLSIDDLQTPGVIVSHLALEQVRTTQDGETRITHVEGGAATGNFGESGGSAVTLTDSSSENSGTTTFQLEFHQNIFNLDKFVDGSTEDLRVDATAVITYGEGRRRRLMNLGHKLRSTGETKVAVAYRCASVSDKNVCKRAKTTDGRCKWNKRNCVPKKLETDCSTMPVKRCKLSDKCTFNAKDKSCISAMKLKCADIANTEKLCRATPGCLTIMQGKRFKSCRGTVKMG